MTTFVYLVTRGQYSDYEILEVFAVKADAETWIHREFGLPPEGDSWTSIQEWELHESVPERDTPSASLDSSSRI